MFGRAVDVVSRNAVNRLLTGRGQEYAAARSFGSCRTKSYRCGSTKSAPIWLFAMVIPACRTSWWTRKTLQCTGLIDLGRLGTADRYADLALMIANAEENRQRQMKQSAPSLSYSMYWASHLVHYTDHLSAVTKLVVIPYIKYTAVILHYGRLRIDYTSIA